MSEQFSLAIEPVVTISDRRYSRGARFEVDPRGMVTNGGLHLISATTTRRSSVVDPFVTMLDAVAVTLKIPAWLKLKRR